MRNATTVFAAELLCVAASFAASGPDVRGSTSGKLVVFGDEWVVSDRAFELDRVTTTQFARNVGEYFSPAESGSFLVFSSNPIAYGTEFVAVLTAAGHAVSVNPAGFALDAQVLQQYNGVFLAGFQGSGQSNASILADYIERGGSVFVMAGTGAPFAGSIDEASRWNHLLNLYGMAFGPTYYGLPAAGSLLDIPVVPTVSLLGRNLDSLLWGYGQEVIITEPANPAIRTELAGDFSGVNQAPSPPVMGIAGSYNIPSCSLADIAAPFGILDLADIADFIAAFLGANSIADMNADGLYDLGDINLFIESFMIGCNE